MFNLSSTLSVLGKTAADDILEYFIFFIPRHTIVAGYYGFTLDIHVSAVRPSVSQPYARPSVRISFPDDNLSKHQYVFSTKLVCALIL